VSGDYRDFLRERLPQSCRPGPIRDSAGAIRGSHQGLAYYTVGQRRGLGIGSASALYVIDIDPERNEITVGAGRELLTSSVDVTGLNCIAIPELAEPRRVLARLRHGQTAVPARLVPDPPDGARLCFEQPQRAVAPGQAAVFYEPEDPDLVVGGGTVRRRGPATSPAHDGPKEHDA
jgi:tRNA-specific 2-thiouridylase